MKTDNTRVLVIALAGNVGIAIAKFVAAAMTGSSAMLTEGVHSLVDSVNQLLLMYGQRRAAKPADAKHPAGYGRELYFWSFVVALLVFALGAGVSVYEGVLHILTPEPQTSPIVAYIVLGIAFVLEAATGLPALREFEAGRGDKSRWQAFRDAKDPSNIIVLTENGAAMAGVLVAALGLGLSRLTGDPRYDGVASIVIGLILAVVALLLARESMGLLIGEAADPTMIEGLRRAASCRGVMGIGEIFTLHNAPDQIVAAMAVDFENSLTAADVERIVQEIEDRVRVDFPTITRIYVRPFEDAGTRFDDGQTVA